MCKQHLAVQKIEQPGVIRTVLSPALLLDIAGRLKEWAYGYCPEPMPTIRIISEWQEQPKKSSDKTPKDQKHAERNGQNHKSDEDVDNLPDEEIGILNSFYAQDIHSIIRQIGEGQSSAALSAYLGTKPDRPATDLYGTEGNKTIWRHLRPKYWNRGRWLSEPQHGLSLMQQFAVNTFFLEKSSLGATYCTGNHLGYVYLDKIARNLFAKISRNTMPCRLMTILGDCFLAPWAKKAIGRRYGRDCFSSPKIMTNAKDTMNRCTKAFGNGAAVIKVFRLPKHKKTSNGNSILSSRN